MDFHLRWSPDARDHLAGLSGNQRTTALDGAETHLKDHPDQATKRKKLLRENPIATWELRLGDLRLFCNIDAEQHAVEIVAVGVKDHNRLVIGGQEIEL